MKKILNFISMLALFLVLSACSLKEIESFPVQEGYLEYELDEPLEAKTVGFGAEIEPDTFFADKNNCYYDYENGKINEEYAELLEKRIADMNLQFARIRWHPEFFERENDNDDPDVWDENGDGVDMNSLEMQSLYAILDICERNNVKIDLAYEGCFVGSWTSLDDKYDYSWLSYHDIWANEGQTEFNWITGPYDFNEYAENIAALLNQLINVKGYTCIYGVSSVSENFTDIEGNFNWSEFTKMQHIINEKLIKEGLRDKVKFLSHDMSTSPSILEGLEEDVKDCVDVIGISNYKWDNTVYQETMDNIFEEYYEVAKRLGKEKYGLYISEFCQGGNFTDSVNKTDIDNYEAALYIARFLVSASTHGFTAINHYILNDVWFHNGFYHTMGLFMTKENYNVWDFDTSSYVEFAVHPEYYTYGLITKYTDSGSTVYPLSQRGLGKYDSPNEDISVAAYLLPDNSWTYVIINNGNIEHNVSILNGKSIRAKKMNVYLVTEDTIPKNRDAVLPSSYMTISTKEGTASVTVPPKSVTVLSSKGMKK